MLVMERSTLIAKLALLWLWCKYPLAFQAHIKMRLFDIRGIYLEKEALAIIFAVKKFYSYIYGRKFTVVTDHKPLISILGPKSGLPALAAARMQRWAITLSAYQYNLEFRPTKKHTNTDGLSRLPIESKVSFLMHHCST